MSAAEGGGRHVDNAVLRRFADREVIIASRRRGLFSQ